MVWYHRQKLVYRKNASVIHTMEVFVSVFVPCFSNFSCVIEVAEVMVCYSRLVVTEMIGLSDVFLSPQHDIDVGLLLKT